MLLCDKGVSYVLLQHGNVNTDGLRDEWATGLITPSVLGLQVGRRIGLILSQINLIVFYFYFLIISDADLIDV